jgi:hypothetical protein
MMAAVATICGDVLRRHRGLRGVLVEYAAHHANWHGEYDGGVVLRGDTVQRLKITQLQKKRNNI